MTTFWIISHLNYFTRSKFYLGFIKSNTRNICLNFLINAYGQISNTTVLQALNLKLLKCCRIRMLMMPQALNLKLLQRCRIWKLMMP